jgi:hypothetical protein
MANSTHVLAGGVDILWVSRLLGHLSVATTQIYLAVDPVRLASCVLVSTLAALLGAPRESLPSIACPMLGRFNIEVQHSAQ